MIARHAAAAAAAWMASISSVISILSPTATPPASSSAFQVRP